MIAIIIEIMRCQSVGLIGGGDVGSLDESVLAYILTNPHCVVVTTGDDEIEFTITNNICSHDRSGVAGDVQRTRLSDLIAKDCEELNGINRALRNNDFVTRTGVDFGGFQSRGRCEQWVCDRLAEYA